MNFLKKIVIFCIAFIVLFTGISTFLNFKCGVEISPTLTSSVFAFFGTELVSTAFIRIIQERAEEQERQRQKEAEEKLKMEGKFENKPKI